MRVDGVLRRSVVVWVVQYRAEAGWVRWSAHSYRVQAWQAMREARQQYASTRASRKRFRVVEYMPEVRA